MASKRKQPVLLHLLGSLDSGKTTLAKILLENLQPPSMLAVDASPGLSLYHSIQADFHKDAPPEHTLSELIQHIDAAPISRQSMDMSLSQLPSTISEHPPEIDLLPVGNVPKEIPPYTQDLLAYGVPRLFQSYDLTIWDGPWGPFQPWLDTLPCQHVIVLTPEDESYCQEPDIANLDHGWVVLSRALDHHQLPPSAMERVKSGQWHYIGKLPPIDEQRDQYDALSDLLRECFYKLDFPAAWSQQWV